MKNLLKKIWPQLSDRNLILLGEIHGIKENIKIIKIFTETFIAEKIPIVLTFEWPHSLNKEINDFIGLRSKKFLWQNWKFYYYGDGRISREHIALLKWLRLINKGLPQKMRIVVNCFDYEEDDWNKRDKKMANNLKMLYHKNPNKKILAIMGNLHASKSKEAKVVPLGFNLRFLNPLSIKLEYDSGKFFNIGLKKINPSRKPVKSLNIKQYNGKEFDYKLIIPKAHPVSL